jgi:ATP-binding cassette subfamily F protein uup
LVSHDRYFLDKLTDHLFVFEGNGKIKDFNGNYKDYRVFEKAQAKLNAEVGNTSSKSVNTNPSDTVQKPKLSFKEKQELENLDKELEKLENEKKELTFKISSSNINHSELNELSQKIEKIIQTLEVKELRWLELSELA